MITEDRIIPYIKEFKQIVGAKILDFKMVQCEFDPHQYWPTFNMQIDKHTKFNLILSQDEEGNGGGFAFIE